MSTRSMVLGERQRIHATPMSAKLTRTTIQSIVDYYNLTKPNITFLVVLSSAAGFCLGTVGPMNYVRLIHAVVAVALLSSGIGAMNQYMERDLDGLMRRTAGRPLPSGNLSARRALWFGIIITVMAEVYLALALNLLTAVLGFATFASYLFVYTPLKTRTKWCTFLGAFPGAMPPLVGWAAVRGNVSLEGWVLFAIVFFWQFPHFHSIAMMYRDDYARAGIRMLPVVEPDGRATGREIIGYTLALLPFSVFPYFLGMAGRLYLAGAVILGISFFYFAARCARNKTRLQARYLLQATVFYLPLLFGLMVLNQIG